MKNKLRKEVLHGSGAFNRRRKPRPTTPTSPSQLTPTSPPTEDDDVGKPVDDDVDHVRDERITRSVHIVLGLVIAALGAWLLYRSRTELAFRGPNSEPGPGYLPVLLTIGLIGLGLLLTAVWVFGSRARHGEAPTLSLEPRQMGRALLVWLALGSECIPHRAARLPPCRGSLCAAGDFGDRADPLHPADHHAAATAASHVLAVRHLARGATSRRNPVVLNNFGELRRTGGRR